MNPAALVLLKKFKQERIAIAADTIPTPLATYMHIYISACNSCYMNYMLGARMLARYLAPIDIPAPTIATSAIPDMLVSYELQEIAKILKQHSVIPLSTNQIESAIYEYLITKSR